MISITALGESDLRVHGESVERVLHQPKRFALLVYLAIETRTRAIRRDTVVGVFWPEHTEERARRSLNQALHYLRQSLGAGALRRRGDEVWLDPAQVQCDAAEFLTAYEAGDFPRANRLYKGDLLPGFHIDGPDFSDWLDRERARLRRLAGESAWSHAEQARAEGAIITAATLARRAADLSFGSEPIVRDQIELLLGIGDREGALVAYDALRKRLQEYDAEPAPDTTRLIAQREPKDVIREGDGESVQPADAVAPPAIRVFDLAPPLDGRRGTTTRTRASWHSRWMRVQAPMLTMLEVEDSPSSSSSSLPWPPS